MAGSLATVGYHQPLSVALVETVRPRLRPHDVVLSQNAWNYLPRATFARLLGPYEPRRRGLYCARRAVAGVNARRARTNVVLSHYMADLLSARGLDAVVAPVTLPLDLCDTDPPSMRAPSGIDRSYVLVPGTLTPYKNADYAIDLLRLLPEQQRPLLVFAGTDDGSGQQQRITRALNRAGLRHWLGPVTREEMSWLLVHAVATVVPSRLESLSLSVAEALALSPQVLASPLPVHREVARRLAREPRWIPDEPDLATAQMLLETPSEVPAVDRAPFRQEWHDLAALLAARSQDR